MGFFFDPIVKHGRARQFATNMLDA